MPISKINCWGKILEGSIINTDGCQSIKLAYDGLILNGYTHHRVLNKIFWQKMNSPKDYLWQKSCQWHRIFLELFKEKIGKI